MMKKLLSVIMSICMLLTLVVVPVNVFATETEVAYEDTTLGSYYKFTFGEDEFYNYTIDGTETYKNNTFMPLHVQKNLDAKVGYKEVTDSVTGEKYDTLEIVNGANITFTPVTKDGQPFELTPGKEYVIKVQYFNPLSNCWVHQFVSVGQNFAEGQTEGVWGKYIDVSDGSYLNTNYPYGTASSISNQGGGAWHYAVKDGTYGKTSKFTDYNEGACLHTLDEDFGLTCTHTNTAQNSKSPYIAQERSLTLPADHFTYDEENMSYSADRVIYTYNSTTKVYTATEDSLSVNNYLSFYLGGGNVAQYSKSDYPLYGNYTYDDFYDAEGTRQNVYTSYQIESIEIYEAGVGSVNFHVGDEVNTVEGAAGETAALYIPEAPEGKYFVGWYSDADFTTLVTAAPTITEGAPTEIYAKFNAYPSSLTIDYTKRTTESYPTLSHPFIYNYSYYAQYKAGGYSGIYNTENGVTFFPSNSSFGNKVSGSGTVKFYNASFTQKTYGLTGNHYVISKDGEYASIGWGQTAHQPFANDDGTIFAVKPNTTYTVSITYKTENKYDAEELGVSVNTNVHLGYGYNVSEASNTADRNKSFANQVWAVSLDANKVMTDFETVTGSFTTASFDSSTILPVVGLYISGHRVLAQKSATGETYDVDGVTYDVYEIIDVPGVTIKEITIKENKKVNFVAYDGTTTTTAFAPDSTITYPVLENGEYYTAQWSLSADEYVAVPETMGDADITVYEYRTKTKNIVSFVQDGATTEGYYADGETIVYPALTASLNYDYVWSLSATEYKEVPETMGDADITVYALQNPVRSFENYPVYTADANNLANYSPALPYDNELNTQVTTEDAYTGTHSMKLRDHYVQIQTSEPTDWATNWTAYYEYDAEAEKWVKLTSAEAPTFEANKYGMWRNAVETGMTVIQQFPKCDSISFSYKVSFKYKATANNTEASTLSARLFPYTNIWWGRETITGSFTFPAGATDGWQTGEMYVTVSDYTALSSGSYSTAGYVYVLDLQWNGKGTQYNNEIYIDDITITEDFVNTPTLYVHYGDEVATVTDGITAAGTVDLSTIEQNIPENKYFLYWTDAAGNEITSVTMPAATALCEAHVYANYGSYPDGVTYDTTGATQPTLKGYGAFTSSTLNESGWARKSYTAEGVKFEKALGGANRFYPTKTDGFNQTSSLDHYVAIATDAEVGTQTTAGWGAYANYVLRDKDGNAVMAKPNTSYAVSVTYEKLSEGSQTLAVGIGRKTDYITTGANDKGYSTYNRFYSTNFGFGDLEITGENDTQTFFVTTGEFTEGDVPVISLHYGASNFVVERVAEAEGVTSYEVNGTTYYPYKIVSAPGILVKDVQIIEVESGNKTVTYKYYEEGVGFSAVIKDNVPGAAIDVSTKNVDKNWYTSEVANQTSGITTYPSANTVLYNADYLMAHVKDITSPNASFYFGDGATTAGGELTFENVEIDGKYALKYSSDVAVTYNDVQVLRLDDVQDGHTYKFTASFKADEMTGNLSLVLATAQHVNVWGKRATIGTKVVSADAVTVGEWTTITYYFTADAIGAVTDETETGIDYTTNAASFDTLFLHFVQGSDVSNTVYLADIVVEDLGEAVATGGASVLTDEAAAVASQQAMRYYFKYATTDGSDVTLGGETFKVVERGFIYRNGSLANGANEVNFLPTENWLKQKKNDNFNSCWAYADGVMTFSTYITGFDLESDTKKLEVKAYLIIEDANGTQYYITSKSINRTIDGVKGLGEATDGDFFAGS